MNSYLMEDIDSYFGRKEIAKQSVTYDRIEMYIDYVLHDLEGYEKTLEKFKNENRGEKDINRLQYKVDYAKYILGLTIEKPDYNLLKEKI